MGTTWGPCGDHVGTKWGPPGWSPRPTGFPPVLHVVHTWQHGSPMGPGGNHVGTKWGPRGDHVGTTWGPRGDQVGTAWGPCGDHVGTTWGPSGNLKPNLNTWGPSGDQVGTTWGPCGDHVGTKWGPPGWSPRPTGFSPVLHVVHTWQHGSPLAPSWSPPGQTKSNPASAAMAKLNYHHNINRFRQVRVPTRIPQLFNVAALGI